MTLLCHIPGCRLLHVTREESTALRISAQAKRDHARCPRCRTVSRSVHSRYHRRPADLPTSGQEVRLTLTIRRFYCHDPACARRTFAERLPGLLDRYAQRTCRLADAQVRTALALGATPAARLLPHLAMPTSATTLLRGIRKCPLPTGSKPIIVGVDDWAAKRRSALAILLTLASGLIIGYFSKYIVDEYVGSAERPTWRQLERLQTSAFGPLSETIRQVGNQSPSDRRPADEVPTTHTDRGLAFYNLGAVNARDGNTPESVYWWKQSVKTCQAEAFAFLGDAYINGEGVATDTRTGFQLLRLASALGSEKATNRVIELLRSG